jgi:hypothetical protein
MNKKQLYSAPEAELLVVRYEGNFCQTGQESGTLPDDEYDDQGEF